MAVARADAAAERDGVHPPRLGFQLRIVDERVRRVEDLQDGGETEVSDAVHDENRDIHVANSTECVGYDTAIARIHRLGFPV